MVRASCRAWRRLMPLRRARQHPSAIPNARLLGWGEALYRFSKSFGIFKASASLPVHDRVRRRFFGQLRRSNVVLRGALVRHLRGAGRGGGRADAAGCRGSACGSLRMARASGGFLGWGGGVDLRLGRPSFIASSAVSSAVPLGFLIFAALLVLPGHYLWRHTSAAWASCIRGVSRLVKVSASGDGKMKRSSRGLAACKAC